jgi:hypothetical protein
MRLSVPFLGLGDHFQQSCDEKSLKKKDTTADHAGSLQLGARGSKLEVSPQGSFLGTIFP